MSNKKRKLTRDERRQIEIVIAKAKRTDKKELSAQDSIPYQRMYPDGICRITEKFYTKTIQFQDINYQLSQNEDKTAIFEGWSDFLNYFDSSIRFQLSFLNLSAAQDGTRSVSIPLQADQFDDMRQEYSEMLQTQLAKGNNGLTKTKYLTLDLNLDYSDDESPLSLKVDFLLSFCDIIVGSKDGLQPVEKTVIDRCVWLVYQKYLTDPKPERMPILGDLYNTLRAQTEKEAQFIATDLEIYVTGSLNIFNHRTNVDIDNRIVCYDIKELGKQLKQLGMLVIQDQVWNRVTVNRAAGRTTRYYVDEFHRGFRQSVVDILTIGIL